MTFPHLTNDPHLRRALALWACLAVAVCVKTAWHDNQHSVYPQFAASSHHWWADKSLYADYGPTEHIDGYRYSPAFAVAFTPLAYLPARLGTMLWNIAGIALLLWTLHVFVRDVLPGEWPARRESTFLSLALAGSAVGIWSGQSNAIITAAILWALAAIVRQRWWTASALLAVAVFIKIWPLALVMLLVVFWPRQLTWRFAVVCAVLALVPFLTRPPRVVAWQYREWYEGLTGPLQGRWGGYRDAWTIWEQFSNPNHHIYMAMQLVGAIGVLGWCWWQHRRLKGIANPGHFLVLILSMWASWQLFLGPGTEQLTYGIIAPSAAWAVMASFAEKRARWLTVTTCAMLTLLPSGDIEKGIRLVFPSGVILLPLGVVLFVAWLVWHERGTNLSS